MQIEFLIFDIKEKTIYIFLLNPC